MLLPILLLIATLVLLNYYLNTEEQKKNWTVYGSNKCSWTRKQLKHMEKNKIPHEFVDCDKIGCDDIGAFPTLKHKNGKTIIGYSTDLL